MEAKSDSELQGMTGAFRERLDNGASLDDLHPEAFCGSRGIQARSRNATLRRAAHWRRLLHRGSVAEMRTGEGKTLVATLSTYLNALDGRGVHVVTVNDTWPPAMREWMGRLYNGSDSRWA